MEHIKARGEERGLTLIGFSRASVVNYLLEKESHYPIHYNKLLVGTEVTQSGALFVIANLIDDELARALSIDLLLVFGDLKDLMGAIGDRFSGTHPTNKSISKTGTI